MPEYYCNNCDWEGLLTELIDDPNEETDEEGNDIMLCPECESADIEDIDAVGPDDYRTQNPREMPRE